MFCFVACPNCWIRRLESMDVKTHRSVWHWCIGKRFLLSAASQGHSSDAPQIPSDTGNASARLRLQRASPECGASSVSAAFLRGVVPVVVVPPRSVVRLEGVILRAWCAWCSTRSRSRSCRSRSRSRRTSEEEQLWRCVVERCGGHILVDGLEPVIPEKMTTCWPTPYNCHSGCECGSVWVSLWKLLSNCDSSFEPFFCFVTFILMQGLLLPGRSYQATCVAYLERQNDRKTERENERMRER